LPAVPVDYVDGAPIRYSRELGVVWSAGEKNLVISAANQEIAKGENVEWLTFAESEAGAELGLGVPGAEGTAADR
jgi:hypothetical protein